MNFSVARSNYTWSPLTTIVFKDDLEAQVPGTIQKFGWCLALFCWS